MNFSLRMALALAALCVPLFAQGTLEGNIPFAFELSGTVLPAGEYEVRLAPPVMLQNKADPGWTSFVLTYSLYQPTWDRNKEATKLVFNKYGDRYFLAEIWSMARSHGIPKSRQERELVTSRLVTGVRPERVVIAATLVR